MSGIIRLRGEAPDLVWPEAALRPHLTRRSELRDRRQEWCTSRPGQREWYDANLAAHAVSVGVFAKAQGWRPSRGFALNRLLRQCPRWAADVVDHPDYFSEGRRSPAVVVHLYGTLALDDVPSAIVVDRLPESWYWPGQTIAYALRPDPQS
jgi:hypothetical protein